MRRLRLLGLAAALAAAAGCGDGGPVATQPVSGQVLFEGKPAEGVVVTFYPVEAPTIPAVPRHPHGVTGPDGSFTLSTYAAGDGAPEGSYRVLLNWSPAAAAEEGEENGEDGPLSDKLLGWYDLAHTELKAEVRPGQNAIPPFKLRKAARPAGAIEGIPGMN